MKPPTRALALILYVLLLPLTLTAEIFEPNVASLGQYRCAEWFRDAKFGIYVHWGVSSVAERSEWYAREMYEEGGPV